MIAANDINSSLASDVRELRWYHTLELPGGVTTPGEYDLRAALHRVPMPSSLEGKRCLDVGTSNGFWAFEMERRGASEVVAIDVEDPSRYDFPFPVPEITREHRLQLADRRKGFELAHHALESDVVPLDRSVYDLAPNVDGYFDFATVGTLLLHLRDPIGALAAIASVLKGQLLCNEAVSVVLSLLQPRRPMARMLEVDRAPFWWLPNLAALRRYLHTAGFEIVDSGGPYLVGHGPGFHTLPFRPWRVFSVGPLGQILLRIGAPHGWVSGQKV